MSKKKKIAVYIIIFVFLLVGTVFLLNFTNYSFVKSRAVNYLCDKYDAEKDEFELVDYLCGEEIKSPNATEIWRIRCQYVAMTRAKGLLCMALPKEAISQEQKNKMINIGWIFKEI